jgi:hypothetical protein
MYKDNNSNCNLMSLPFNITVVDDDIDLDNIFFDFFALLYELLILYKNFNNVLLFRYMYNLGIYHSSSYK